MKDTKYLEIIKAPVVTEKSETAKADGKYTFKVEVTSIRTIIVKSKKKRVGRYTGLTNRTKKAIVTLKEGQTIDLG